MSDPLGLELEVVVSYWIWVQGNELRSCEKPASAFKS